MSTEAGGPSTGRLVAYSKSSTWLTFCSVAGRFELSKRCKVDVGEFSDREESFAFDVARSTKAGLHAFEIGIIVAGVRDKFPCAGGEALKQRT